MRLFTAEIIVRMEAGADAPSIECRATGEEGVTEEIIRTMLPAVLHKIADDNAMQNPTIVERD